MKRRVLLSAALLATVGRPLCVRAQQSGTQRRIALVMNQVEQNPRGQVLKNALLQGLKDRGWTEGGNLRIHYRWVGNDVPSYRKHAEEIVALAPEDT